MDTPLNIFLFQYLGMGIIFVVGIVFGVRQGDIGLAKGRRRRNLIMLLGGLIVYLLLHGFFQFVAVRF
ncbi:MAG: hypothetical protein V1754_11315 [Pseudomonadota bacterium]